MCSVLMRKQFPNSGKQIYLLLSVIFFDLRVLCCMPFLSPFCISQADASFDFAILSIFRTKDVRIKTCATDRLEWFLFAGCLYANLFGSNSVFKSVTFGMSSLLIMHAVMKFNNWLFLVKNEFSDRSNRTNYRKPLSFLFLFSKLIRK